MKPVEREIRPDTITGLKHLLQTDPDLLDGTVRVILSGKAFTVEQGLVTESARLWGAAVQSWLSAPSKGELQALIIQFKPATSSAEPMHPSGAAGGEQQKPINLPLRRTASSDCILEATSQGATGDAAAEGDEAAEWQKPMNPPLRRTGLSASSDCILELEAAPQMGGGSLLARLRQSAPALTNMQIVLAKLKGASTPTEFKEILTESIQSIEELPLLVSVKDKLFKKIQEPLLEHISILVAAKHVKNMLDGESDALIITRCLAQHKDFTRVSCGNVLFNDAASYIKSDLQTSVICELICRIRGCTAKELRVEHQEIMGSGTGPLFEKARTQTGRALRETRKDAAEKVLDHLDVVSPGKSGHLLFLDWMVNDINQKIEDILMEKLSFTEHNLLLKEMAKLRAGACVSDVTGKLARRELEECMRTLHKSCFTHSSVSLERVVEVLLDGQSLISEIELLNFLTVGTRRAEYLTNKNNQRMLKKEFLEQFTTQLESKFLEKLPPQEGSNHRQIVASIPLFRSLKAITRTLSYGT